MIIIIFNILRFEFYILHFAFYIKCFMFYVLYFTVSTDIDTDTLAQSCFNLTDEFCGYPMFLLIWAMLERKRFFSADVFPYQS